MFSLAPLGDLTRFRRRKIRNEVFLIAEDVRIMSCGVLLAARSAKIEKILEESENIPADEFSGNVAGLEDCLDLLYGGSIVIGEDNYEAIYKFGTLFQICEMTVGVLKWIANDMAYDTFWKVYLELKNLHEDCSVFVDTLKGYLSTVGNMFMKHTIELCRSQGKNTVTPVIELLSRIDALRVLSVMEDLVDKATENNETESSTDGDTNNYLQAVLSFTVSYIDNYLTSNSCDEFKKLRCKQALKKTESVCTNIETFQTITKINLDTSIQLSSCWNFTTQSVTDLNQERVKQLTFSNNFMRRYQVLCSSCGKRNPSLCCGGDCSKVVECKDR